MTFAECEIVADAGVRLRVIADGLISGAKLEPGTEQSSYLYSMARHVDEVRVRLCALPLETEV